MGVSAAGSGGTRHQVGCCNEIPTAFREAMCLRSFFPKRRWLNVPIESAHHSNPSDSHVFTMARPVVLVLSALLRDLDGFANSVAM